MKEIKTIADWTGFCTDPSFTRPGMTSHPYIYAGLKQAEALGYIYYDKTQKLYALGPDMTKELLSAYFATLYGQIAGTSKEAVPWLVFNTLFGFKNAGLKQSWYDVNHKIQKNRKNIEGLGTCNEDPSNVPGLEEVMTAAAFKDPKSIFGRDEVSFFIDRVLELRQLQSELSSASAELEAMSKELGARDTAKRIRKTRKKLEGVFKGFHGNWKSIDNFIGE